jgi:predicted RNase H-like HicB family nuclease
MSARRHAIIIERGPGSFGAYPPDIPRCAVVGDTEAEVRMLIAEAIEFHSEALRTHGEAIPEPSSSVDYVEFAA